MGILTSGCLYFNSKSKCSGSGSGSKGSTQKGMVSKFLVEALHGGMKHICIMIKNNQNFAVLWTRICFGLAVLNPDPYYE